MQISVRLIYIALALALFSCSAQGIMYLTSGSDSYGKGLSYPGYKVPPAITGFVAGDHTSRLAPVFLGATIRRPELANISSANRSVYNQATSLAWASFSQHTSYPTWSALGILNDGYAPAVKEFMQPALWPGAIDYQLQAQQPFAKDDWEPPELDKDNYPGMVEFLKDEEDLPERRLI